jgi:hypothetical protein
MKPDKQTWHDYICDARSNTNIDKMVSLMYDSRLSIYYDKLEQLKNVYRPLLEMSFGNVKHRGSPVVIIKYVLSDNFKGREKYGKYGFRLQCLISGRCSKSIKLDEFEKYGILSEWQDTGGPFSDKLTLPNVIDPALRKYYDMQSVLYRAIYQTQVKYISDSNEIINTEWKNRYNEYLFSYDWRQKRNLVIENDYHNCTKCQSKDNLQVHHMTYENVGKEDIRDLITLCRDCHTEIHSLPYQDRLEAELRCLEYRQLMKD